MTQGAIMQLEIFLVVLLLIIGAALTVVGILITVAIFAAAGYLMGIKDELHAGLEYQKRCDDEFFGPIDEDDDDRRAFQRRA
jgi:hypothetical protein